MIGIAEMTYPVQSTGASRSMGDLEGETEAMSKQTRQVEIM
jgi:hypothetical protein